MTIQGHRRSKSLSLAPIESAYGISYWSSVINNLGPILPYFRDIRAFVRRKPLFPYRTHIPVKIWGVSFGVDP